MWEENPAGCDDQSFCQLCMCGDTETALMPSSARQMRNALKGVRLLADSSNTH